MLTAKPRSGLAERMRPATLAAVALALIAAGQPARAQEKLPQADKILEKTIDAQGGREAFEKIKNRVMKGTFSVIMNGETAADGTIEIHEAAPNLQHYMIDLGPHGQFEGGSDGETIWQTGSGGVKIFNGDEKIVRGRSSQFNSHLFWREHYPNVECVAKEDVDGRPCYKVVLTPDVGPALTRYFDRKTGLPIKTESTDKDEDVEYTSSTILEDYRKVDGLLLAHKSLRTVTYVGEEGKVPPPRTFVIVWNSIQQNVNVPASKFDLPFMVKAQVQSMKKQ